MRLPRTPYSLRETVGVVRRMFGDGHPSSAWREPRTFRLGAGEPARWIGFVGDVMPLMWREATFAADIASFFADCEVVVGNLEGILTRQNWFPFLQKHTPAIFEYLARAAPREKWVLGVANNHAPDFGDDDFAGTLRAIERFGMRWVGSLDRPSIDLLPDVTLTAWTEWTNGPTALVPLRDPGPPAHGAIHIAYPHWGYEMERSPRPAQRRSLPKYDAVVGHHAHLPQEPEIVDGRLVAWSLGNFVTEVRLRTMGEGALLKLGVARDAGGAPTLVVAHARPIRLDRSDRRRCAVALA